MAASEPGLGPPSRCPCASCPYRRDVPSGVWAPEEYEKLRRYDAPTMEQPPQVFLCHQKNRDTANRVGAGWAPGGRASTTVRTCSRCDSP